jgi:hypothetical protein
MGAEAHDEGGIWRYRRRKFQANRAIWTNGMFEARNIHDTLGPQKIQQLIYKNQTPTGFNFPIMPATASRERAFLSFST